MKVEIRQFRGADQKRVRDFIFAGMEERWDDIDESMNPDIDDISGSYGPENFFVAWSGGTLVATGGLLQESDAVVRLARMWVEKGLQRSGIGSQMLAHLPSIAQGRNYSRAVLETTDTLYDAISFYEKHGFTVERRRDGEVHFCKNLNVQLRDMGRVSLGDRNGRG